MAAICAVAAASEANTDDIDAAIYRRGEHGGVRGEWTSYEKEDD